MRLTSLYKALTNRLWTCKRHWIYWWKTTLKRDHPSFKTAFLNHLLKHRFRFVSMEVGKSPIFTPSIAFRQCRKPVLGVCPWPRNACLFVCCCICLTTLVQFSCYYLCKQILQQTVSMHAFVVMNAENYVERLLSVQTVVTLDNLQQNQAKTVCVDRHITDC